MRAAVLHAPGDLRIEDRPMPCPSAGEVLLRVAACGICGSDVPRMLTRGAHRHPIVCGHEFAGVVAGRGLEVEDLAIGAQVTVFPLVWCGRCAQCATNAFHRCQDYDYLGSRRDGGFAEYAVVPRRNVLPLPATVSLEQGAMAEPAAVALHALQRAGVPAGGCVAVIGAGTIGLLVAQCARILGAAQVLIFDLAAANLACARGLGFSQAHRAQDVEAQVEALTSGRGADLVIEAAGAPAALQAAIGATAPGGSVVLLGNPSTDVVLSTTLIGRLMRREVTLFGTWNSAFGDQDDWRAVLDLVARSDLRLDPLITHRLPLDGLAEGLRLMRDRPGFVAKVLILPGET